MWKTVQHSIRKAFNHAAINYEALSSLHKEIARDLAKKLLHIEAKRVIDVGTGTGYLANKAKFYFPESEVFGVDLSEGMLAAADKFKEGIVLVQGDAEALPFRNETFDLIISNLSYQWMDLSKAFAEAHRCLTPKGTFAITLFGSRTFEELFEAWEATSGQHAQSLKRLPSQKYVKESFPRTFSNLCIDYELIKIQFADVWELLTWTKNIGANKLNTEAFLGKERLEKAQLYYKEHFPYHNGICATFEVIWVTAQK